MRKYALCQHDQAVDTADGFVVQKVMIYSDENKNVYLFLYDSVQDTSCRADLWFESAEQAEAACRESYGIDEEDWITADNPLPFCQHDIVLPTRVVGRAEGTPQWGRFEELVDVHWKERSERGNQSG